VQHANIYYSIWFVYAHHLARKLVYSYGECGLQLFNNIVMFEVDGIIERSSVPDISLREI